MPVQNYMLLWYLPASVYHQLYHLQEMGFTKWYLVRIDVSSFECSKEELARSSIVAVWPHLGDRHPKPLQHLHRTSCFVVRST